MFERWIPVPTQFHSLYHEGPFTRCIDCDRDLTSGDCIYFIERAFRGTEPIFEMAMCEDCRDKIEEGLSKESTMRIGAFVEERLDFEMRYQATQQWPDNEVENWLEQCAFLKTPKAECRDYQIAGICRGDQMSIDLFPIMISGAAAEEIQKLMSKQTRDRLGDMVQDFFGMPSEFADSPRTSPLIF